MLRQKVFTATSLVRHFGQIEGDKARPLLDQIVNFERYLLAYILLEVLWEEQLFLLVLGQSAARIQNEVKHGL